MKLKQLIAGAAIALCPIAATAGQFSFSYTFGSGDVVTGSLFGTQNGLYVENISNVSASLNGTLFSGSPNLNQFGWIPGCCTTTTPPVVYFDGNFNNFFFADTSNVNLSGASNWFAMLGNNGPYQSAGVSWNHFGSPSHYSSDVSFNGVQVISPEIQGAFNAGNWVLAPVPEPETYAMLLAGLGLLGFAARRRKLKLAA